MTLLYKKSKNQRKTQIYNKDFSSSIYIPTTAGKTAEPNGLAFLKRNTSVPKEVTKAKQNYFFFQIYPFLKNTDFFFKISFFLINGQRQVSSANCAYNSKTNLLVHPVLQGLII